ncbi:MAG: phage holin family protein [Rhodospirillales bacterium]|jgi:hypothetical protein|nr:phage holin family protein [Rhodospirillales bacterium]
MNTMMWMGLLGGTVERLKATMRQRIAGIVVVAAGAIFIACAVGFALAATHMWLSLHMAEHLAALSIAGSLGLVGLVVIAVGRRRACAPMPPIDVAGQVDLAAKRARQETASALDSHLPTALLGALVLGLAAGLLRPKGKD